MRIVRLLSVVAVTVLCLATANAEWNQFRGSNGSGVAVDCKPPVRIDAGKATWKIESPPGQSSPVLSNDLIIITAVDGDRLVTIAYAKSDGALVWRKDAPKSPPEKIHPSGSRAAASACVDGDRVYVYFGAYGLICYDLKGAEVWKKPIPTPRSLYGMSTSPIVHGDLLLMVLDNDANMPKSRVSQSRIIALNKMNGKKVWEAHRPFHRSGWSTPTIWKRKGGTELVVLGNGQLRGYDVNTGDEKWHVNGFSRETIAIPIVGDGLVYAAASMRGGVADDKPDPEPFWKAVAQFDTNKDGKLVRSEMTEHFTFPFRPELPPGHPGFGMPLPKDAGRRKQRLDGMFHGIDKNKDGFWTREEFLSVLSFNNRVKPQLVAVKPGGRGDVTSSHVAWSIRRGLPEIPSPVLYKDRIYMIRDGGLLSVANARDGKLIHRARTGASGHYRASPVIADDYLYVISEPGVVSVFRAGDEAELVHQHDLGDTVAATPAIDASTIYIRTKTRLMAFRKD